MNRILYANISQATKPIKSFGDFFGTLGKDVQSTKINLQEYANELSKGAPELMKFGMSFDRIRSTIIGLDDNFKKLQLSVSDIINLQAGLRSIEPGKAAGMIKLAQRAGVDTTQFLGKIPAGASPLELSAIFQKAAEKDPGKMAAMIGQTLAKIAPKELTTMGEKWQFITKQTSEIGGPASKLLSNLPYEDFVKMYSGGTFKSLMGQAPIIPTQQMTEAQLKMQEDAAQKAQILQGLSTGGINPDTLRRIPKAIQHYGLKEVSGALIDQEETGKQAIGGFRKISITDQMATAISSVISEAIKKQPIVVNSEIHVDGKKIPIEKVSARRG